MNKKSVAQNYTFLGIMLGAMILGALFGWLAPSAAVAIKPLGTVFINMMFCIVVPLVFASISGAVANMKSRKRAGKIMGTTIATFVVTGAIAAVTTTLARHRVNIANMQVYRRKLGGDAMMVLELDGAPSQADLDIIRQIPDIRSCTFLKRRDD